MREEIALVCLTALGVAAMATGRDEGLYITVINAITAVILVAKSKKKE